MMVARPWTPFAWLLLASCSASAPAPRVEPPAAVEVGTVGPPAPPSPLLVRFGGSAPDAAEGTMMPRPGGGRIVGARHHIAFDDALVAFPDESHRGLIGAIDRDLALVYRADPPTLELWSPAGERWREELAGGRDAHANYAAAMGAFAYAVANDTISVRNGDGRELGRIRHPRARFAKLALADAGRRLLVASFDEIALYEVATGKALHRETAGEDAYPTAAALDRDGTRFVVRHRRDALVMRDEGGVEIARWQPDEYDEIERLAISGQHVIARADHVSDGRKLLVFSLGSKQPAELPASSFQLDPDSDEHVLVRRASQLLRCTLASATCPLPDRHDGAVTALAAHDSWLVSGDGSGLVLVHDLSGESVRSRALLQTFRPQLPRMTLSRAGLTLAGWLDPEARAGYLNEVVESVAHYRFDDDGELASRPAWTSPTGWRRGVVALGAPASGRWVLGLDETGDVTLWDPLVGRPGLRLPLGQLVGDRYDRQARPSRLTDDGALLLQHDRLLSLPDAVAEPFDTPLDPRECHVAANTSTPRLACRDGKVVRVHERNDAGWSVRELAPHLSEREHIVAHAVSADGTVAVAVASRDEGGALWLERASDDESWTRRLRLDSAITALSFYAGGARLAAGHRDGSISLWAMPDD